MFTFPEIFSLKGKTALITGAAGGIGHVIAEMFVDAGADIVLADINESELNTLVKTLSQLSASKSPVQVSAMPVDLSSQTSIDHLCQNLDGMHIDILINCAGIEGHVGQLDQCSDEQWAKLLQINLTACQQLTKAVLPGMRKTGFGRLIYVASIAGLRGNKSIGLYGIAKAALVQLARNYAVQAGPDGVTANAIAPGLIDTPLSKHLQADSAFMQRRMQMTPLRRLGHSAEIAATALYLASAAGGFTTGQTLVVDGGTLITDGN
jgi:NAD(P)-dependent dehydrogenase (short-subunit alcohol dehydrogenase family)